MRGQQDRSRQDIMYGIARLLVVIRQGYMWLGIGRTVDVVFEDSGLVDSREVAPSKDVQQRCLSASTVTAVQLRIVSAEARDQTRRGRKCTRICGGGGGFVGGRDANTGDAPGASEVVQMGGDDLQKHQLALDGL